MAKIGSFGSTITDFLRKAKVTVITRSSFAAKRGEVMKIKIAKGVFRINTITVSLHDKAGKLLTEQKLVRPDSKKMFDFKLTDDFLHYSSVKIITEEPLDNTYTIHASEIMFLPIPD